MLLNRSGLTEGSLLFNDWLKNFNLYRSDTEDEFINWLYSTSGFYDKDIYGSYFDIDTKAVRESEIYQEWKQRTLSSWQNSDIFDLMIHSSYHLNGTEKKQEFQQLFSDQSNSYWRDIPFLKENIKGKTLVISSFAPLIEQEHDVLGYQTPYTFFNSGPDKNALETLDRVYEELPKDFDTAVISFGSYGSILADMLYKDSKDVIVVGSSILKLYPVKEIPAEFRPKDYLNIEDGRYWK